MTSFLVVRLLYKYTFVVPYFVFICLKWELVVCFEVMVLRFGFEVMVLRFGFEVWFWGFHVWFWGLRLWFWFTCHFQQYFSYIAVVVLLFVIGDIVYNYSLNFLSRFLSIVLCFCVINSTIVFLWRAWHSSKWTIYLSNTYLSCNDLTFNF